MEFQERREYPRHTLSKSLRAVLYSNTEGEKDGCIQNVSRSGAFLRNCFIDGECKAIKLKPKDKKSITKKCKVIRMDYNDRNWLAIKFEPALSEYEINVIRGVYFTGDKANYDFAKSDRFEIFRETYQIKSCSSNVFIWAIGLISTIVIAIYTLAIQKYLSFTTTLPAIISMIGIFTIAVLYNIEKARAINKREGFMAALDFYLNKGEGPYNYKGWVNLKHSLAECGAGRRAMICPREISPPPNKEKTCRDIGEIKAGKLLYAKREVPSILDSFVVLTSILYAILYIILITCFSLSLSMMNKEIYGLSILMTFISFSIGFLIGLVLWKNWITVIAFIIGIIASYITGTLIINYDIGIASFIINYAIVMASLCSGVLLGLLAWFLSRQVRILRIKHNSFEACMYTWLEVIDNCMFLPDELTQQITKLSLNRWQRFNTWLFDSSKKARNGDAKG